MMGLSSAPLYSGQVVDVTRLRERYGKNWLEYLLAGLVTVHQYKTNFLATERCSPEGVRERLASYIRLHGKDCPSGKLSDELFCYHALEFWLKIAESSSRCLVDFGDFDSLTWTGAGERVFRRILDAPLDEIEPWNTSALFYELRAEHAPETRRKIHATAGSLLIAGSAWFEITEGFLSEFFLSLQNFWFLQAL